MRSVKKHFCNGPVCVVIIIIIYVITEVPIYNVMLFNTNILQNVNFSTNILSAMHLYSLKQRFSFNIIILGNKYRRLFIEIQLHNYNK